MPATDEAQLEVAIGLRESGDLDAAHRLRCVLVSRIMARDGRTTQEAQVALSQLGRTLRAMGRGDRRLVPSGTGTELVTKLAASLLTV